MSTNEYIRNVKQYNWPPFNKKIWQRNYFEHIIRNEQSLEKIRNYIFNNPGSWLDDIENLKNHETIADQQRKDYYRNIF
jgi:REP element-mobilizing transposase RayT